MLFLAFGLFVLLLYRVGHFDDYLGFRKMQLLEENVMQAYDDARWDDRMSDFRQEHPELHDRPYMSFGRR